MKKQRIAYVALISLLVLAVMVPVAGAFETYSTNKSTGNCADCHGNFRAAPYISNHDGVQWALGLHDAHRNNMLSGDCNVCHVTARFPVSTFSSAGGTGFPAIGCSGCHDGAGLRAHHVNSGAAPSGTASYCYDCHNATTPPAENINPPYYFTPDTAHPNKPTDPCNLNGTESALAPTLGLDNDGNLLYDQNDPACAAAGDVMAPTVTKFAIPATRSSLVVPIFAFTATDNVGVTGYKVTMSITQPLANSTGWTKIPPTNYTFPGAGTKTLYAWAKDAAGNVSLSKSDTVVITLTDFAKPIVTAFGATPSATPLTATITTFTATDNVKVTGYRITETPKAPLAGAVGWKWTAPTSYVSKTSGTKTLYAWAKDAAGRVSLSMSTVVTIP